MGPTWGPSGAEMGPIWGRQDPGGPHVGPMKIAIWNMLFAQHQTEILSTIFFLLQLLLSVFCKMLANQLIVYGAPNQH